MHDEKRDIKNSIVGTRYQSERNLSRCHGRTGLDGYCSKSHKNIVKGEVRKDLKD